MMVALTPPHTPSYQGADKAAADYMGERHPAAAGDPSPRGGSPSRVSASLANLRVGNRIVCYRFQIHGMLDRRRALRRPSLNELDSDLMSHVRTGRTLGRPFEGGGRATEARRARIQAMGTSSHERLLSVVERLRSADRREGVRPARNPITIGAATAQMAVDGLGWGKLDAPRSKHWPPITQFRLTDLFAQKNTKKTLLK
jgi:hypothetical protein